MASKFIQMQVIVGNSTNKSLWKLVTDQSLLTAKRCHIFIVAKQSIMLLFEK
jgi:hypothetical protein